ncbi:5-aminoimidazole-4-carboxamide ribonucleotide transformylase [Amycolatopsis sp. NPDC051373]|uniref:5-aminoimidazole-4-carboxamide ribonucleotide transformylase n=1 Tax=Amycolatopsis sp. NPDC051373 TaxID=3155801 RepID=UPI00344C1329
MIDLRYGTHPHQPAWVLDDGPLRVRAGTPSFINLLDALNAWQLVRTASAATGAVVAASFKHVSPAGVASAGGLDDVIRETWRVTEPGPLTGAYVRARDADPKSGFGDVVAVSAPVDAELADLLSQVISDAVIAPGFEPGTLEVLVRKKSGTFLVLEADPAYEPPECERRDVHGVVVAQRRDRAPFLPGLPSDALLGVATLRHTQSNSVAVVGDGMPLGIGAGQQNRVDCVRLAVGKARTWWLRRHPVVRTLPRVPGMSRQDRLNWQIRLAEGRLTPAQEVEFTELFPGFPLVLPDPGPWASRATLVSDGLLPFRDNIEHAATIGISHVVEPGGSTRSPDVADACARHGMSLTHTGLRLFHH